MHDTRGLIVSTIIGLLALCSPAAAGVSLTGDSATLEWGVVFSGPWSSGSLSPSTSGSSPPFLNTFGATTIGQASPTFADPALGVDVNVSGATVTVTENSAAFSTSFAAEAFNGFVLRDLTKPIGGAVLAASSVPGLTSSYIRVIGGELWVDFNNLVISGGERVTIDLTPTAAVPEPSSWAMLLLGFACVGAVAFRRSRGYASSSLSVNRRNRGPRPSPSIGLPAFAVSDTMTPARIR